MIENSKEIISIPKNNIDIQDAKNIDKLATGIDSFIEKKEKTKESTQTQTTTNTQNQQVKKDSILTTEIKNENDLISTLDKYINENKKLPKNIKIRINNAITSLGESEEKLKNPIKYYFNKIIYIIIKILSIGLYNKNDKRYNMRLATELNERMRKIVNNSK